MILKNTPRSLGFLFWRSSDSKHCLMNDSGLYPRKRGQKFCFQENFKFDLGASTLGAPPPPWEARRRPRIEVPSPLSASVENLCCRALYFRHVCPVANGLLIEGCAIRCFSPGFCIFTFRSCSKTSANFDRNRNEFDLRLSFAILFRHISNCFFCMCLDNACLVINSSANQI